MTLYQLGEEYLRQADDLRGVIKGYSAHKNQAFGVELFDLNTKIVVLKEMERDTRITGKKLLEYYSKNSIKKTYHPHRFD